MTAVTPVFFLSWIPSVFTYGGQQSTDTLGKPIWKKKTSFLFFLQFELQIFQNDKRSLLLFKHVLNILRTSREIWDHHHECLKHHIPPLGRRKGSTDDGKSPKLVVPPRFTWYWELYISGRNFDFRVDFVRCKSRISRTLPLRPTPGKMSIIYLLMK